MNNEWITDRRPTEDDAIGHEGLVWAWRKSRWTDDGPKQIWAEFWFDVELGTPWAPITPPAPPDVQKKRYEVTEYHLPGKYLVRDKVDGSCMCVRVPTREAAERIAAIYEEAMP